MSLPKITWFFIACALLGFLACNSVNTEVQKHRGSLMVGNQKRHFLKFISGNSNKLIIALHGAKETDWLMKEQSRLNEIAQDEFSIIYPQGVEMQWNDARGVTAPSQCHVNDKGFISQLIDSAKVWMNNEMPEVYLIGYSNGGLMAQTYALEVDNPLLKGIALFASPLPAKLRETICPNPTLKVIYFEGEQDPIMPFSGGKVKSCSGGFVLSAFESARVWCKEFGLSFCQIPKAELHKIIDENIKHPVAIYKYPNEALQLVVFPNGGHQIPGGMPLFPKSTFGPYQYFPGLKYALGFFKN